MPNYTWDQQFTDLFDKCLELFRGGNKDFDSYYSADDSAFLESIGHKPREFFDFVEDFVDWDGEPSRETALLVAAVRRDYFLTIQGGVKSDVEMEESALPGREEELDGYKWLPRIVQKARNKLRGDNCPDIMYSCGGDRAFLKPLDIHPADFLRVVWAAKNDDSKIVEYVRKSASGGN